MKRIRINSYWILGLVGLISFIALFILLLETLAPQKPFSIGSFAQNMLVSTPFALLITLVDYKLVLYLNVAKWVNQHIVKRVVIETLALMLLAVSFVIVGNLLLLKDNVSILSFLSSSQTYVSAITSILINVFIVTIIEFFMQIKKNTQLQKENLEMQYQQLKNQINPHFLFNSLNVLTSLIHKDSDLATAYTQKLAEIYRYVLSQDNKKVIFVEDELEFIKTYMEILQIRFGENLHCTFELNKEDAQKLIPPMSLQLLIENAVKHNVITAKHPLSIEIYSEGGYLHVRNNISPRISTEKSTGIGLKNLEKKYKILSNQRIITQKSENYFSVKLPLL